MILDKSNLKLTVFDSSSKFCIIYSGNKNIRNKIWILNYAFKLHQSSYKNEIIAYYK